MANYIPVNLGHVETSILSKIAINQDLSTYQLAKKFTKSKTRLNSVYKNIHKRIKRLEALNYIEQLDEKFERGAKHYRITPYGMAALLAEYELNNFTYIQSTLENSLTKSLLLTYFEESTIKSITSLRDPHNRLVAEYLFECANLIKKTSIAIRNKINKFELEKILPDENTMQKFLYYLDEKVVSNDVLLEIEKYESRLKQHLTTLEMRGSFENLLKELNSYDYVRYKYSLSERVKDRNDPFKRMYEPPFPFNYVYIELDFLDLSLYDKAANLAISLVTLLGEQYLGFREYYEEELKEYELNGYKEVEEEIKKLTPIEYFIRHYGMDSSVAALLVDNKMISLINSVKEDFEVGYKLFEQHK